MKQARVFTGRHIARQWSLWQRWLFPPQCLLCKESGEGELDLCAGCFDTLPWLGAACVQCALPIEPGDHGLRCGACLGTAQPLAAVRGVFLYQWPVDALLRRFKFHGDLVSGRLLAQLMARPLAPACVGPAILVPVPLHARRLRQRGYDQATELTRLLAPVLGLPWRRALCRRVATQAQTTLDAAQRQRNVHGAFHCVAPVPRRVVLVDDVMTTGATLHAAARALRRAGAVQVEAWICARAP